MGKRLRYMALTMSVLCLSVCLTIASAQRPGRNLGGRQRDRQTAAGYRLTLELGEGKSVQQLAKAMPKRLPYYECSVDMAAANRMCDAVQQRLGVTGKRVKDEDGDESVMSNHREVELIGASGSVFAADLNRLWAELPRPGNQSLGEDEARNAAIGFLKQIGAPLGDADAVRVFRDTVVLNDREGRPQQLPGPVQVSIRPALNGLPVVGAGGKLKVYFDNNGKIAGCLVVRRKWTRASAEAEVLPLATALRRMAAGEAMTALTLERPQRIAVRDISLGYFARSASEHQSYLQPVYVFRGIASGGVGADAWETPYEGYLVALAKPLESLWEPQDDSAGSLNVDRTGTLPPEGDE